MSQVVVMGVTGCGKSTVGLLLAHALEVPFVDGDSLHPQANIDKMAQLIPLTDEDRWPWLVDVGAWLAEHRTGGVVACSALKRSYREAIRASAPNVVFVHLAAPQQVLEERVRTRAIAEGHFAGPGLLDSQYMALEDLTPDEGGLVIDVTTTSAPAVAQAAATEIAGR
ncbi:MAG: gluconate kinase [Actinobacteria bacterium HGW-Actinobacteria-4]|nr:MAG: gluconate kinase [Actinobacteria bacterium HGW-Actinobacteria-4]